MAARVHSLRFSVFSADYREIFLPASAGEEGLLSVGLLVEKWTFGGDKPGEIRAYGD
jgi:hypothetical protein